MCRTCLSESQDGNGLKSIYSVASVVFDEPKCSFSEMHATASPKEENVCLADMLDECCKPIVSSETLSNS